MRSVSDAPARAAELERLADEWRGCAKCALASSRTQVVVGTGDPDSDLMFVGQAGKVLERLLATIGLTRPQVYIANVLKCRPPGNRDPQPEEIEACEAHLFRQIELIEPKVVATLGNFATKLLSGRPLGITRVHGQEQEVQLGGNRVVLYPLYPPAAALYTPKMLEVLQSDFARLPELMGRVLAPPPPPVELAPPPVLAAEPAVQL